MNIEAMKQALEALTFRVSIDKELEAITALRQALKEAENPTHTDHPMRHWDRTCPACVAEAEKQDVPEPLMKIIREKFTSSNSVPVSTIILRRSECEAALAKPEQEPVAWMKGKELTFKPPFKGHTEGWIKLYTAPPKTEQDNPKLQLDAIERAYFHGKQQGIAESEAIKRLWVGLTDEDIRTLIYHNGHITSSLVIETEAMLKERNT
jgi:hypothetical protein